MDHRLLEAIVCPVCHGKLNLDKSKNELICRIDSLAYPIENGFPVLIESEARILTDEEKNK